MFRGLPSLKPPLDEPLLAPPSPEGPACAGENQRRWKAIGREETGLQRIIPRLKGTPDGDPLIYDEDRRAPRIHRHGEDIQQAADTDEEPGLLTAFPNRGRNRPLIDLHKPSGKRPSPLPRIVTPPHQQDLPILFHQHSDSDLRIIENDIPAGRTKRALPAEQEPMRQAGATTRAEKKGLGTHSRISRPERGDDPFVSATAVA